MRRAQEEEGPQGEGRGEVAELRGGMASLKEKKGVVGWGADGCGIGAKEEGSGEAEGTGGGGGRERERREL